MKTELKAKFLQHMVKKNQDKGFTLIELLVVIIIIGILSAIALPSFLNQAAKAKQTEAKNYIGSVTRAQQAYRIEKPTFAGTISQLEIGIPTATQDYTYTLNPTTGVEASTSVLANATDRALRDYSGAVVVQTTGQTAVLTCQTTAPGGAAPALNLTPGTTAPTCPGGSEPMR